MTVPGRKLEFGWRLSLADVSVAGPFSRFPGISRLLGILEGRLRLEVNGLSAQELVPGGPALPFAGDAPAFGTPLSVTVRDINLMFDPSCFAASLNFFTVQDEERGSAAAHLLLAVEPLTLNGHRVGPLNAALIPAGVSFVVQGRSFWKASLTPLTDWPVGAQLAK